jgi:hypothetical protein
LNNIIETCRQAISTDHGISVQAVVLVKMRTIPKTTSGKIARLWCKKAFEDGTLQVSAQWANLSKDMGENVDAETREDAPAAVLMNTDPPEAQGNMELQSLVPPAQAAEDLRSLSLEVIVGLLEERLIQISASSPSGPLTSPIDKNAALVSLGLDSMTLVQYKGVLENR